MSRKKRTVVYLTVHFAFCHRDKVPLTRASLPVYSLPQFDFRAVIQQGEPLASRSFWYTERLLSVGAAGNRHTDNLLTLSPLARNTAGQEIPCKTFVTKFHL
jgi:hypothetical protein